MTKSRKPPVHPDGISKYRASGAATFTPEEKATYEAFMRGREEMRWRVAVEEAAATPPSSPDSPRYSYRSNWD